MKAFSYPHFISENIHRQIRKVLAPISAFCNKLGKETPSSIEGTQKNGERITLPIQTLFEARDLLKEMRHVSPQEIFLEDNNGGDYLKIRVIDQENIELEVGHCCVVYFHVKMPVGILTAMLAYWSCDGFPTCWDGQKYGEKLRARLSSMEPGRPIPPLKKEEF